MSVFTSPFHTLKLQRIPLRQRETLQAWDAADEYLLSYLNERDLSSNSLAGGTSLLVCNDNFGALSLNLLDYEPSHYTDSRIAELAISHNAGNNDLNLEYLKQIPSTELPEGRWDLVVMKLPKNMSWFREQLLRIKPFLHENSQVIVAAMVKHLPHSALDALKKIIGPATLSRAQKKARLLLATADTSIKLPESKYPKQWEITNARREHNGIKLVNHANTFSGDSLDIGARFFIEHLPEGKRGNIIDLGCGNGILGIATAMQNDAHITFVDESHMAVASARDSWAANGNNPDGATFKVNDALRDFRESSADCILCNPPFHQQNTVGDQIAQRMFRDAHKVLKPGGELRVVGNRHLGYHISLKKLFGNCELVVGNSKFVVLSSVR
ncbi:MAG: methyltransferase [Endozoicomonas sp.]